MLRFALKTLALAQSARISPEKVARIQGRRLRSMVRHAIARSPYYREKYRGIDPRRFELTDLPPTNKGELMANYDRVVTSPLLCRSELERFVDDPANEGTLFRGRFAISHTSGSQGQPMLIAQEPSQLALLFALQMSRGNSRRANPVEAARRFVRPARLAVVTLKRGFYPSASTFEYMPAPARRFLDVLRLSQTDPDVVERLNAFRPNVLTGYASVLETLALEALGGRLRLDPELIQVVNNSEVLTDRARARIQGAFGLPVMNNYATGECPFLTNACRAGLGPHVNADWAILEIVDEAYRPVPAGVAGKKVLITNLANTAQPFLRYEVGDVVTMATTPCGCGNALPRVERIEGRSADVFWIRDGSTYRQVINSIFKNAFDYTREVREWQAVQTARNRVLVRLELLAGTHLDAPHAWAAIDRQLAMYDLTGRLEISLELVDRLAPDPKTGKFRRMVSQVGPPEGFSPDGFPMAVVPPFVSAA